MSFGIPVRNGLGVGLLASTSLSTRNRAGFSPASLFAAGEPGVWYDPSDFSTMFQDSVGTTPVTAAGQSVGFLGDKSQGFVLGPELVTNGAGGFSGTTGWVGGTISESGGRFTLAGNGGADPNTRLPLSGYAAGKWFEISGTIFSAGGTPTNSNYIRLTNGNGSFVGAVGWIGASTYTGPFRAIVSVPAGWTGMAISVQRGGNPVPVETTLVLSNISVRELAGNHATQSSAASRPILGRVPVGGRRNLLTFTEQFDNAAWAKQSQGSATVPTVTANAGTAPDGTTTAERVQFARTGTTGTDRSRIEQTSIPVIASTNYTFSVWLKSFGGADQTVTIFPNYGNGASVAVTVTSEWQRFTVTANTLAGVTAAVVVGLGYVTNSVTAADVLMWGAQLETGSTATAYQRVVTAFDVTQAGVADCYYLSFDGSDDFMLTGTITPGTDKAQVFAGVRKLSDAAAGTIAETSVNSGSNAGSFGVFSAGYGGAAAAYAANLFGSQRSSFDATTYTAPITNVLTATFDTAQATRASEIGVRVDGVVPTLTGGGFADAGTGNFTAQPLYIGRRGGTTLPFNGQLYSLIVRFGANLSAATITQTETWVGVETGVNIPLWQSKTIYNRSEVAILDRANETIEVR